MEALQIINIVLGTAGFIISILNYLLSREPGWAASACFALCYALSNF